MGACVKKQGWLVLIAFMGGILLANLSKRELLTTYGILNTYFLNQYSYSVINYDSLFCHICMERLKDAILIFLLGKLVRGKVFFLFLECLVAATFGFLMVVAITNLGLKGIAVTLCGMFPQWIFYLGALFLYASSIRSNTEPYWNRDGGAVFKTVTAHAGLFLLTALLLFSGVVSESYINPILLKKLLTIF